MSTDTFRTGSSASANAGTREQKQVRPPRNHQSPRTQARADVSLAESPLDQQRQALFRGSQCERRSQLFDNAQRLLIAHSSPTIRRNAGLPVNFHPALRTNPRLILHQVIPTQPTMPGRNPPPAVPIPEIGSGSGNEDERKPERRTYRLADDAGILFGKITAPICWLPSSYDWQLKSQVNEWSRREIPAGYKTPLAIASETGELRGRPDITSEPNRTRSKSGSSIHRSPAKGVANAENPQDQ